MIPIGWDIAWFYFRNNYIDSSVINYWKDKFYPIEDEL